MLAPGRPFAERDRRKEINMTGPSTLAQQRRLPRLWHLTWPAILEQLLGMTVSFADTAMVGSLGASSTAGVSVVSSSIWLINGILSGGGGGLFRPGGQRRGGGGPRPGPEGHPPGGAGGGGAGHLGPGGDGAALPLHPQVAGGGTGGVPPGGELSALLLPGPALRRRPVGVLRHHPLHRGHQDAFVPQRPGQCGEHRAQLLPHL